MIKLALEVIFILTDVVSENCGIFRHTVLNDLSPLIGVVESRVWGPLAS